MSHFAKINSDNIVIQVIVAEQDFINSGAVGDSFLWVQCSYNDNFRKNFAGIGSTYDKVSDMFIPIKLHPSWVLNEDLYQWVPPLPYPTDGLTYTWNEETTNWITSE